MDDMLIWELGVSCADRLRGELGRRRGEMESHKQRANGKEISAGVQRGKGHCRLWGRVVAVGQAGRMHYHYLLLLVH